MIERKREIEKNNQEIVNNILRHSKNYREALGFFNDNDETNLNYYPCITVGVSSAFTVDDTPNPKNSGEYFKGGYFFPYGAKSNKARIKLKVSAMVFQLYPNRDPIGLSTWKLYKTDGTLCLPHGPHVFARFSSFKCSDGSSYLCSGLWDQSFYPGSYNGGSWMHFEMSFVPEAWHQLIIKQILKQWPH
ncbi:MAG: hypothetical protein AABZ49_04315 [Thermoproteota archaeon]